MSNYNEQGLVFNSGSNRLVGIVALPQEAARIGVLIIVGGPQYRVGSHRQFTLLARALAEAGIASFRFDYAGMGDSEGEKCEFGGTKEDIFAAAEAFRAAVPGVSHLVLWGLCDAASSAMIFAHCHSVVTGMILLNPWVHSGEYAPEIKLMHFYRPFLSKKNILRRLVSEKGKIVPVLRELSRDALTLLRKRSGRSSLKASEEGFVKDMLNGLQSFQHDVLIVLSGADLTASEFSSLIMNDPEWKTAIAKPGITVSTVMAADHTFSNRPWAEDVSQKTIAWVMQRINTAMD